MNLEMIGERTRSVEIRRRRASLWRRTAERSRAAGARANDAAYLVDLLESGKDLEPISVRDGDEADA